MTLGVCDVPDDEQQLLPRTFFFSFCFVFFSLTRQLVLAIRQQRRDKGVLPTAQIHRVAEEGD